MFRLTIGEGLTFTFPEIGEGVTAVTDEVDTKTVLYYKTEYLLTPFPAFSFDATGPKEKANKKKRAEKISLLRERPRLRLWNPQTFEKV